MTTAARYYEIEQQKLLLDFEKITLFTNHPTSLGTYRERRLREYLREFTPMQLSLSTGFVVDGAPATGLVSGQISRQIDCLVYDASRLHPELHTDDYVVIRPESLFAAIEVKSTLTFYQQEMKATDDASKFPIEKSGKYFRWAGTLVDALANIKSIKDVCPPRGRAFFGVFGYSANFAWRNVYEALDNGELQVQLGLNHVDDFPPVICVPANFMINISPYDLSEHAPHHDPYMAHFNYIGATKDAPAYPLQFFTTYFLNHVGVGLNGLLPRAGGVNSGGAPGAVTIWSHPFDLSSKGHEDQ